MLTTKDDRLHTLLSGSTEMKTNSHNGHTFLVDPKPPPLAAKPKFFTHDVKQLYFFGLAVKPPQL